MNHDANISPPVKSVTVMENIKYPDLSATDEEAISACKAAALHDKIQTFTHGYGEKVGERGTKLSGGELQRLAIARAILKNAHILLLDEATSNVDSVTEAAIQSALADICRGKTAFVIAHRLSTILRADQILVVEDGRVVEAGVHDELVRRVGGPYHRLWSSQLKLGDGRSRDGGGGGDDGKLIDDIDTDVDADSDLLLADGNGNGGVGGEGSGVSTATTPIISKPTGRESPASGGSSTLKDKEVDENVDNEHDKDAKTDENEDYAT